MYASYFIAFVVSLVRVSNSNHCDAKEGVHNLKFNMQHCKCERSVQINDSATCGHNVR